jgi:hypothetical protein
MYGSIWRFEGDPDELAESYDAMIAEIPAGNIRLHLCLRDRDGIVVVDTCPSRAAFEAFVDGPFQMLRGQHGLPEPVRMDGFLVHVAFVAGERVETAAVV